MTSFADFAGTQSLQTHWCPNSPFRVRGAPFVYLAKLCRHASWHTQWCTNRPFSVRGARFGPFRRSPGHKRCASKSSVSRAASTVCIFCMTSTGRNACRHTGVKLSVSRAACTVCVFCTACPARKLCRQMGAQIVAFACVMHVFGTNFTQTVGRSTVECMLT